MVSVKLRFLVLEPSITPAKWEGAAQMAMTAIACTVNLIQMHAACFLQHLLIVHSSTQSRY